MRTCPINVNYRYTADELVYLLDNSDSEVLVYQGCYASRLAEIQQRLPRRIVFVDRVRRAPNGKADYKWARGAALEVS